MTDAVPSPFLSLGLDEALVTTITKLGYSVPTPIQRLAIPPFIAGNDVLGQAGTGTGKTAAFALPILQRLAPFERSNDARPVALVLVPTRELAIQVTNAFKDYGQGRRAKIVAVYGGAPIGPQIRDLKGAHVVVATPGRAIDHLTRGTLDLSGVRCVVLDEADEMLDMGFAEDLETLLSAAPEERQTALFSATMAPHVAAIAARRQRDPVRLKAEDPRAASKEALVEQLVCMVPEPQRLAAFERVLLAEQPKSALVFCRTREDVDAVCAALNDDGFAADALHGGLSQSQRDGVMGRFREGKTVLLVATDVAARGLDISDVSHVFNFDLPEAPEVYVHRIGRTGRAGRTGTAISFVAPFQRARLRRIEALLKTRLAMIDVPTAAQVRKAQQKRLRATIEAALEKENDLFELAIELGAQHGAEKVAAAALALLSENRGAELVLAKANDQAFTAPRPFPPRDGKPGFKKPFNKKPFGPAKKKPGQGQWVPRHLQAPLQ